MKYFYSVIFIVFILGTLFNPQFSSGKIIATTLAGAIIISFLGILRGKIDKLGWLANLIGEIAVIIDLFSLLGGLLFLGWGWPRPDVISPTTIFFVVMSIISVILLLHLDKRRRAPQTK